MSFNKKSIIVVDMNKTIVLYMGIMLKRMGFNVVPADCGSEALKLMKMVTPDLVVMDACLPSNEGYETLVEIRRGQHTKEVPVILMSGSPDEKFEKKCTEAGCNGFLPKPIPMDLLHEHIQDFIFAPLGFRRKHLRVQADVRMMVTHEDSFKEYRTATVSEGGAYLKTDAPLKVGTRVGITIPREPKPLNLKGVVIYIKTMQEENSDIPRGMAVEFSDVTSLDMLALNRYVSDLIAGDLTEADGQKVLTMPWQARAASRLDARKDK